MRDFIKWYNIKKGFIVAILGTAGSLPYLYYCYYIHFPVPIQAQLGSKPVLVTMLNDVRLMFLAFAICGTIGFAWSKRYGLPGLGSIETLKKDIKWLVGVGIFFAVLSYPLFDRVLLQLLPEMYPDSPLWALGYVIKTPLFDEIIFRFGFLTLIHRLLRNRPAAIVLSSIICVMGAVRMFSFLGIEFGFNLLTILSMIARVGSGLILGYLYVRKGLLHTMTLQAIIELRLVLLALL